MCQCVYTNWRRPVLSRDFDRLADRFEDEPRTLDLVHALREAFPESGMRPNVFIVSLIIESFRAVGGSFVDSVVPGMVRFPFGVYVYDDDREVVSRHQTRFQETVHDQMPEFLMSAQTVHRLNRVLARFGYMMLTDGCCGEIFLPQDGASAFLASPLIAKREAARLRATEQGMRFKVVPTTAFVPIARSDFGAAERELHDSVQRLMVALCGPMSRARQLWSSTTPRALAS